MTVCSLNSQISPASKNRALIHHETVKSLRYGQSLISSLSHGYCDVFFVGNVLKVYGSGQSDVRSGTSMTTCYVLNANMDSGEPSSQNCMTKYGSSYTQIVYWLRVSGVWISVFKMFTFTTQHVVIEFPELTSDCPESKTLKTFPTKNTSQYLWPGEEIGNSPGLKGFGVLTVNQCAVLWWGRDLWVETPHSHLPCFEGKQHRTNNKPQNCMKWSWIEPRLNRKSNNRPKFT